MSGSHGFNVKYFTETDFAQTAKSTDQICIGKNLITPNVFIGMSP